MRFTLTIAFAAALVANAGYGVRLKDIMQLRGARDNQLTGYGVVIGLAGTGDKSLELTEGSLANVLKGLGVDLKAQQHLDTKNAAAVVASATLAPFTRAGGKIDVSVSSVGSATSLEGGTLVMTALKGPDGVVYAMAQGKIVTQKRTDGQGRVIAGANLVTALVPAGGILEREVNFDFSSQRDIRLILNNPDFTTAVRVAKKINDELAGKYATANDASTIDVLVPYQYESTPVDLIAQIENLDVESDRKARVVINSRTGTVILGEQVRVAPVAIAHNNLKIEVKETPRAISSTDTNEVPLDTQGGVTTKPANKVMVMAQGTSIADIVASLNEMGASSEDLIALMQSLKASGALMAELEMQ